MKRIVLVIVCALAAFRGMSQDGSPGAPFHFLGQAQSVPSSGIYNFNIGGNAFSTYVEVGGWVLVASSSGTGAASLTHSTAVTLQSDLIIPSAIYTSGTSGITTVRLNSFFGTLGAAAHVPFDVQTTSAIVLNNLSLNQTLSWTLPTFDVSMWTGVGPLDATYMELWGVSDLLPMETHVYHADGNNGGFHWRLPNDENVFYNDNGRNQLNLFVKASFVTLPVHLVSFTAAAETNRVRLNWSTAQESNSDYFSVEKSLDAIHWQSIGKIAAAGNSDIQKYYSFYDAKPVNGTQYYRLKQADKGVDFKYSDTRAVTFGGNKQRDISVYPNPAGDYFTLRVNNISLTNSTVRLVDLAGRILLTQRLNSNSANIDTRGLTPGYYVVEVNDNGKLQRVSMIKK